MVRFFRLAHWQIQMRRRFVCARKILIRTNKTKKCAAVRQPRRMKYLNQRQTDRKIGTQSNGAYRPKDYGCPAASISTQKGEYNICG